jgi:isoamyl acetate esterase
MIMEAAFSDGLYWIARVLYIVEPGRNDDEISKSILSEITTMKFVRANTSIPVPQIYEFEASVDGEFGYLYVLMEHLGGQTLDGILAEKVPKDYRSKVAKQLVNVFFELSTLTYDWIGQLWSENGTVQTTTMIPRAGHNTTMETSLEYFYTARIRENEEAINEHLNDADWLTSCWILRIAIPHFIIDHRIRGKFPLCNLDIHHDNLLFDDDYNLTAVIGWRNAQTAPIERLILCQEFVTFPSLDEEANRPILEFKHLVLQFLTELELGTPTRDMSLSSFRSSVSYNTAFRCVYSNANRTLWMGKLVVRLIFDQSVTWNSSRGSMAVYNLPR